MFKPIKVQFSTEESTYGLLFTCQIAHWLVHYIALAEQKPQSGPKFEFCGAPKPTSLPIRVMWHANLNLWTCSSMSWTVVTHGGSRDQSIHEVWSSYASPFFLSVNSWVMNILQRLTQASIDSAFAATAHEPYHVTHGDTLFPNSWNLWPRFIYSLTLQHVRLYY